MESMELKNKITKIKNLLEWLDIRTSIKKESVNLKTGQYNYLM